MSETDVTENSAETTVTGGKVWNPVPDAKTKKKQEAARKALVGVIAVVGVATLGLFIWQAFFGIPFEGTPEKMSIQDFGWFRWYELLLSVFASVIFFGSMVHSKTLIPSALALVFLFVPACINFGMKENRNEINAWAAQYGYEFPVLLGFSDVGFLPAKNLETGQMEKIEVIQHQGEMLIVGAKKIGSENEAEPLNLNDLEVVINDGKQTFVDITTGKTYTVTVDGSELHLETGK